VNPNSSRFPQSLAAQRFQDLPLLYALNIHMNPVTLEPQGIELRRRRNCTTFVPVKRSTLF
jgi:hypothetical protein